MPWARSFCPFRACCFWSFWALPLLYPSASDFQFPSAGDRWFRAYWVISTVQVEKIPHIDKVLNTSMAGLIFVAASITASPIANTTDILPFILHIPNYSCINNQKSPLPWYRIEIKPLPWHWQNPPASRKICGLNGAFCKLDIQHKSITTGEQIDTQKLLILQWK